MGLETLVLGSSAVAAMVCQLLIQADGDKIVRVSGYVGKFRPALDFSVPMGP